ncbi:MAG TPA: hypothetical protein DDY88_03220 [Actinobacteria bacterium]|nr:hypothetical protein [Actinomycetota bacterium]
MGFTSDKRPTLVASAGTAAAGRRRVGCFSRLAIHPGPVGRGPHRVGTALNGHLTGHWSARRGEYRVVYTFDEEVIIVTILRIGHRGAIHRG